MHYTVGAAWVRYNSWAGSWSGHRLLIHSGIAQSRRPWTRNAMQCSKAGRTLHIPPTSFLETRPSLGGEGWTWTSSIFPLPRRTPKRRPCLDLLYVLRLRNIHFNFNKSRPPLFLDPNSTSNFIYTRHSHGVSCTSIVRR